MLEIEAEFSQEWSEMVTEYSNEHEINLVPLF